MRERDGARARDRARDRDVSRVGSRASFPRKSRPLPPAAGGEISAKADQPGQLDVAANTRCPTTPEYRVPVT